jgi:hypothetical protein
VTTLDEVIETVRTAREDGSEALAAMALSYGATMALAKVRCEVLRRQVAEARGERDAAQKAHNRTLVDLALIMLTSPPGDGTITPEWAVEAVRALRAKYGEVCAARDSARIRAERAELDAARCRAERDAARAEIEGLRVELDALAEKLGAAMMERDGLRADCELLRGEIDRLRALPRIGQPTRAEWDAHRATGGEWIRVSPGPNGGWDCGRALIHEPGVWLIPVRDGRPCVWSVAAEGGA